MDFYAEMQTDRRETGKQAKTGISNDGLYRLKITDFFLFGPQVMSFMCFIMALLMTFLLLVILVVSTLSLDSGLLQHNIILGHLAE